MSSTEQAIRTIRETIARSEVPEDPPHAEDTLRWVLKLDPKADQALQIAALAHDIDRAVTARKVHREEFTDYDEFKSAHARNGAIILREILQSSGVDDALCEEACRLVTLHEVGGDSRSDLLKNADSISYFSVNMPLYFQREGWEETKRRCVWGYHRLSGEMKRVAQSLTYEREELNKLLQTAIREAGHN
ncbi:MAG: DUF4202 family protein [SAR324 cluster bacterium]|nr:DUF4202 family protein [SAR324 cluster bacterium]